MKIIYSFCIGLAILLAFTSGAQVRYVNINATGSNNGSSWANAYTSLSAAILGNGFSEIWVAAGTYNAPANQSFRMFNNRAIYGGFNGTETLRSQRDWVANVTTLMGNNNRVVECSGNSNNPVDSSAKLDGFVITGGTVASGNNFPIGGGGVLCYGASPVLRNLIIKGNSSYSNGGGLCNSSSSCTAVNVTVTQNSANNGGGVYNDGADYSNGIAMPSLRSVVVSSNTASNQGGGVYNHTDGPLFTNCTIKNNTAANDGGGVYNDNPGTAYAPLLVNTLIYGNQASAGIGGGLCTQDGNVKLLNVTVSGNQSLGTASGGVANKNATLYGSNTIMYGNSKGAGVPAQYDPNLINDNSSYSYLTNCIVTGQPGSFTVDPQFVNPTNGDYHLSQGSPAINQGSTTSYTSSVNTDLDGNARIDGNSIDIGAYEYQSGPASVKELSQLSISIYPNPARTQLTIDLGRPANDLGVVITDVNGKKVVDLSMETQGKEIISLGQLPQGIYFVVISTSSLRTASKLIVD